MGISGLLPFLDKCTRRCHVSEFRGSTVAIDTYCWLHKGATACAEQLAQGQPTDVYISYCMKYVKLLLSYDIHPIMVFDGKNLPAKLETEKKRRQSRSTAKQRAAELLCLGKTEEARTYLKQCIDITPQMANALMRECRKLNVDCIVAPYESDAQLAFFNLKGIADFVISEDSDLVLFGCKKVLYKMDLAGSGQLVESDKLYLAMNTRVDQFTFDKFRYMCILSGCDYVDSLPGIGLKKALKFINLTAETNPEIFLEKVPRYLNMRHLSITPEYKQKFLLANATFLHQIVFDPFKRQLVPLRDPDTYGTKPDHCKNAGEIYDNEKALQVSLGNLHPNSFEKLDDWNPSGNRNTSFGMPSNSIWSTTFVKRPSKQTKFQTVTKKSTVVMKSVSKESKGSILREDDEKMEYDKQLSKELLIYTEEKTETTEIPQQKSPEISKPKYDEQVTSPVLKKNPFIVKKKVSKFSSTVIQKSILVRSRFFAQKTEESLSTSQLSDSAGDQTLETNESGEIQLTSSQKENHFEGNKQKDNSESELMDYEHQNLEKLGASALEVPYPKKRPSQDDASCIMDIDDDSKCEETTSQSSSSQMSNEQSPKQICNFEKGVKQETKRRKLATCRNVGLPKQRSQVTLIQMFNQITKKS